MNDPYRDKTLDQLREEIRQKDKAIELAHRETALAKAEDKSIVKSETPALIYKGVIITAAITAAVLTGNGWFILMAFFAL